MSFDRRKFLVGSGMAASAALGAGLLKHAGAAPFTAQSHPGQEGGSGLRHVGSTRTDDFDPYAFLTRFDRGDRVTDLGDGTKLREYDIVAVDKEIEVAPGVSFPAWTYNGQVPGPTLRADQGDTIRIRFRNDGSHPHTMHFHGFHTPAMDGIPGVGDGMIETGDETVYEFKAAPHGCHLYHCHSVPLKRHIHKGLYGAFIVDPPGGFDQVLGQEGGLYAGEADREMVMVMNGFDTNFDGDNEIYAVNTKAFAYTERPIQVQAGELIRIFLVNVTEFDAVNSFHLHANFFDYYDHGRAANRLEMVDTISQIQAQRGILQFRLPDPGPIMFHAHQSEFAELGWLGFFDVQEGAAGSAGGGQDEDTVEGAQRQVEEAVGGPEPEPGGSPPPENATASAAAHDQASTGAGSASTSQPAPSGADGAASLEEAAEQATGGLRKEVLG